MKINPLETLMQHPAPRNTQRLATSTWFLILGIVVMGQYIITLWVRRGGGQNDLVSHVGFAGTIVSTILAILAIVYAYYQTFAQQRDSSSIASQLTLLRTVVEDIRNSRVDLTAEVDRFAEISGKIDQTIQIGEESRSAVKDITTAVEELKRRSENQQRIHPAAPPATSKSIGASLVRSATHTQLVLYYVIALAVDRKLTTGEVRERIMGPAYASDVPPSLKQFVDGMWSAQWQILSDLGLLEFQGGEGGVVLTALAGDFREALKKAVDAPIKIPADPLITIEAVNMAVTAFDASKQERAGT